MGDHQNLNGQHLACEVQTGMCEVLTKSRFSFMVKMIREIILMPRADLGYHHNFMVKWSSWVFKDDECESDAKTNSRHRVCPLLVGSPLLAWSVHAQSLLLAHCVNTHTNKQTNKHKQTHTHTNKQTNKHTQLLANTSKIFD